MAIEGIISMLVLIYACVDAIGARSLQQSYSSAVSVSGGSGPFGNCGFTQTVGNAAVSLLLDVDADGAT